MSIDPKALQRMMDAYADGRLDATEMSALVEHLRTSEAAREHLAVVAVAERLLRAAGQGGVPVDRIMAHVAEAGGAGPRARGVSRARDRKAPHRRLWPWCLLGALAVAAVAAGLWYQGRQAERAVPPMGDGSDEPGFVPPPRIETVAPPSRAVPPDETAIPGGRTPPMTHTEARKPPHPPVIVTKIKEE
ncbi:MAG: zf-HC2 domain-containing protein [Verrucomicrobia bacterium]|nr:zf-HC2 domain-containing protein [Verrucomicrobiota bacterium]